MPLLTGFTSEGIGGLSADSHEPMHCKIRLGVNTLICVIAQVSLDNNHIQHHIHTGAVRPGALLHGHARASCSLQPAAEVYSGQDGGLPDLLAGEEHFLASWPGAQQHSFKHLLV